MDNDRGRVDWGTVEPATTHTARFDWISSKPLATWLAKRRDNDVRVAIGAFRLPLVGFRYDRKGDWILLEAAQGDELYHLQAWVLGQHYWCPERKGAWAFDEDTVCCARPDGHLPLA